MQDGCAKGVQCWTGRKEDKHIQEGGYGTDLSQGKTACGLEGEDLVGQGGVIVMERRA